MIFTAVDNPILTGCAMAHGIAMSNSIEKFNSARNILYMSYYFYVIVLSYVAIHCTRLSTVTSKTPKN